MAEVSNVIAFELLYMRLLQWWLRTKGFSPRGNPFRMIKVMRRCFRALVMWKKPWFLSQGPALGASCRRKMLTTDASLMGWGAILEGRSSQGLWKDHHLSWHINPLEMLAAFLALKNFLADLMEGVRSGTSGSVCISRDISLSTLVLAHASSSSRTRRDGADVAEASSVCIYPGRSAPRSPGESSPGPGSTTSHCPVVAGQSMVPRFNIPLPTGLLWSSPSRGIFCPKQGAGYFTPNQNCGNCGIGLWEGAQLIEPRLLRPFSTPELPPRGNFMP